LEEASTPIGFFTAIGHDRYMTARLNASMTIYGASSNLAINAQFSQGLGNWGAIGDGSGTPYTRQGATPSFSKASLSLYTSTALGHSFRLNISAKGQTSFGQALFRAEQFTLEGDDGLSAYVGGSTAFDMGARARGEISLSARSGLTDSFAPVIAPYIFASFGAGRLQNPTAVEQQDFSAANWGVGLRTTLAKKLTLGFEFAQGLSATKEFDRVSRLNTIMNLRF
jgi:hemolysin activation/secretion protein